VTMVVNEALNKWTNDNMFRCPLDENFCASTEPCNNCQKFTKTTLRK
jgi:hypothetical protein